MKISVVIPCYNSISTIERSIESVLNQSYLPVEIIVVDDGSSDNSKDVIMMLQKKTIIDIIYIYQVNSGPSIARNKGVTIASGDWIAFLDSDDYWDKDKLLRQVEFVEVNSEYVLISNTDIDVLEYKEVSFNMLLRRNYFQTSAVLVKKKVMIEFPFNEKQKYSEDYLCWLEICFSYKCTIISPKAAFPINKSIAFGGNGLSSKLVEMEKWELKNYYYFFKRKHIDFLTFISVSVVSLLKFFRRIFIKIFNE